MTKFFLIHGAFGNPEDNWFPWLNQKLRELNHEVIIPKFQTPENQTLDNWNKVFNEYINQIDKNTIFVGHSLAPAFILNILEHTNVTIKSSFFVSGFIRLLGNKTFDPINQTFVDRSFEWEKINQNCKQFFIYHSDNDPYVPIECSNELADKLYIKPKIIKNAGHFNKQAGYVELEALLNDIKSVL